MRTVNVHEAKTHLSALLAAVEGGEVIVIAKAGKPVAKLSRVQGRTKRVLGQDAGLEYWIADDFDEYVPPEFADYM